MSGKKGYFGKLPDRADFVVGNCPTGFLNLWEPFLMKGLGSSRQLLGSRWEETYMTMPVWRFWLEPVDGSAPFTQAIGGALMPSVDKVGRKFPLTIAVASSPSENSERPSDDWFDEVEAVLLGALEEDASLKDFQKAVSELADISGSGGAKDLADGKSLAADAGTTEKINSLFWCRAGRQVFAFNCAGLPDETAFRWLLLPESFGAEEAGNKLVGKDHGRYHPEDHRT